MEADGGITKEFLEEVLKGSVSKFVVNPGSNVGDGNMCAVFSVDAWLQDQSEPLALLIKCLPTNPMRQQILEGGGIFARELCMYNSIIPDLIKFQKEQNVTEIRLPFAPFYAGKETPIGKRTGPTKQLDNYLVMTDLRKKGGFRLRDRFKGLDFDHYKLVMEEQATLHALSWAFKQTKRKTLNEMNPSLSPEGFPDVFNQYLNSFPSTIDKEIETFKAEPRLCEGLRRLQKIVSPVCRLYWGFPLNEDEKHLTKDNVLKTSGKLVENEESWSVLLHGDCWVNNFLFRCDSITNKPVEVIFIDLQLCHEGDPLADIVYSLYVNTHQDMRRKHLQTFLHVYYETFTQICEQFGVESLAGWSWEEFNRRFYRAQAFGISMSACALPTALKDSSAQKDLDTIQVEENDEEGVQKMVNEMMGGSMEEPRLKERLRGVIEDGRDAGVI